MPILVIVRHGQSQWNLQNKFTGETDVELTDKGKDEARNAGYALKNIVFNFAFTSVLKRAEETLQIILEELHQENIPIKRDKALNERNYGDLQGLDKTETANKYGEAQVSIWRRSYDVRPPGGESLADTAKRVIPYYTREIEPLLKSGFNVLIVAHGNSLRALMMHLENINAIQIEHVELPTGEPKVYTFDNNLKIEKVEVYKN